MKNKFCKLVVRIIVNFKIFPKRLFRRKNVFIFVVLSNLILAGAAVWNIYNTKQTLIVMRNDSILEHRPYVFLDLSGTIFPHLDNEDQVALALTLSNTGKSSGLSIDFDIKKAILIDSSTLKDLKDEDVDELYSKKNSENEIEVVKPSRDPKISLFPQQKAKVGNFVFNKERLQNLWKNEQKVIYVWANLSYKGPPFENAKINYKVKYEFKLGWEKDKNKAYFRISCITPSENQKRVK